MGGIPTRLLRSAPSKPEDTQVASWRKARRLHGLVEFLRARFTSGLARLIPKTFPGSELVTICTGECKRILMNTLSHNAHTHPFGARFAPKASYYLCSLSSKRNTVRVPYPQTLWSPCGLCVKTEGSIQHFVFSKVLPYYVPLNKNIHKHILVLIAVVSPGCPFNYTNPIYHESPPSPETFAPSANSETEALRPFVPSSGSSSPQLHPSGPAPPAGTPPPAIRPKGFLELSAG